MSFRRSWEGSAAGSGGSKAMWGWGGVVCCHLFRLIIYTLCLCVCVAQTTFIIYTQTGNLGRAPHGRLVHHARHPSPVFEEGEGRPWRREGRGRGREVRREGWRILFQDSTCRLAIGPSCELVCDIFLPALESQGVNSGPVHSPYWRCEDRRVLPG